MRRICFCFLAALVIVSCTLGAGEFGPRQRARVLGKFAAEPRTVPADVRGNAVESDPRAAKLGQYLFWYEGFSVTDAEDAGTIEPTACVSCHEPALALTDGKPVAEGALVGARAARNAPTLFHVTQRHFLFWDGRADSAWAQALQPLEDPVEMATNRARIAHVIHDDAALRSAYEAVFGPMPDLSDRDRFPLDALPAGAELGALPEATRRKVERWRSAWNDMSPEDRQAIDHVFADVGKALHAFERRLTLAPAPFDRFVDGLEAKDEAAMDAAMSADAQRGLRRFIRVEGGCVKCHDGPDLTDEQFHNLWLEPGAFAPGLRERGARRVVDDPFNCTGALSDVCDDAARERLRHAEREAKRRRNLGRVRTPSLRNVAKTGPYMHAGQHETLHEVLRFYVDLPRPKDRVGRRNRPYDLLMFDFLSKLEDDEDTLRELEAFLQALSSEPACPQALVRPTSPAGTLDCP